jgi:hypothetical protein
MFPLQVILESSFSDFFVVGGGAKSIKPRYDFLIQQTIQLASSAILTAAIRQKNYACIK